MVVERRLSILVSAAVAFVLLMVLWKAFARPAHRVRAGPASDAPLVVVRAESSAAGRDGAARAASPAPAPGPRVPASGHGRELPARVPRCRPQRVPGLGAGGGAGALRARRRFGVRRSAVPVAHTVRR